MTAGPGCGNIPGIHRTKTDLARFAFGLGAENVEFLAADAQHLTQQTIARAGVTAEPGVEVLVDQSGRVSDHHASAGSGEIGQTPRVSGTQHQHGRQYDGLVRAPVVFERHDVGARPRAEEGAVPVAHIMPMVELHARQRFGAGGPFRFGAEQNRRVGAPQPAALHAGIGQRAQGRAEFAHLSEQLRVLASMRHHGGMERLGTKRGRAPLEEIDRIGAHRHMRERVAHRLALALAGIERLPLHRRRGMFHDVPRLAQRERIHQRVGTRQFVKVGFAFVEIVVVGDEIHLPGPIGVVHAALVGGDHEVRGERLVRADLRDRVALGLVEVEEHVVAESFKIEFLTGIHHGVGAHEPRDEHFVETVHLLAPERGSPRLVERRDGPVLAFAPFAESRQRVVGIVLAVVPSVFVAHMPCGDVWVGTVPFGEFAAQRERVFLEHRAGRAPGLPGTGVDGMAVFVPRKHLGMLFIQPQRSRGRRGGQIGCDAGLAELVDDAVEPAEVPTVFGRLYAVPAEDGERHGVDAGLFHETNVVVPDALRPLVGIVVAAEGDAAAIRGQQFRPVEFTPCVHDAFPLVVVCGSRWMPRLWMAGVQREPVLCAQPLLVTV